MTKELKMEILLSTGMTKNEAKKHSESADIFEVSDMLKFFDNYTYAMEDEDKEKLREYLKKAEDGVCLMDDEITTYNGTKYYIQYCL